MSSDSEPEVIETKIPSDERWIKSLDTKEKAYFDSNLISLEELEDLKVVCSACFKQGNHKQRVRKCHFFNFYQAHLLSTLIDFAFPFSGILCKASHPWRGRLQKL